MKDTLQFVSLSRYLLNRRISKSHFSYIWSSSYNLLIWTRFYDHKISFDKRRNKTDRPVKLSQILLITSNNTMIRLHSSTCLITLIPLIYPITLYKFIYGVDLDAWTRLRRPRESCTTSNLSSIFLIDLPQLPFKVHRNVPFVILIYKNSWIYWRVLYRFFFWKKIIYVVYSFIIGKKMF